MAGGGSVELYHCRILCQSISLLMGCKIWSSVGSYVESRFPVLLLRLGQSLLFSGYFSINNYSFHPQSNGRIECFHRSLKTALCACLAGSDWFNHLPLVFLGLQSVPKEDSGFSVSEAVFGSALTLPGEFLDSGKVLSSQFLQKIEQAVSGFTVPPPHHVSPSPPAPLPQPLLAALLVFVREDASIPLLAPLYCGHYLVVETRLKFFCLQLGDRTDVISASASAYCCTP